MDLLAVTNIHAFVAAVILGFFTYHTTLIEKYLVKWLSKQSGKEKELLAERLALKTDQSRLSLVDDFAKYSKVQRKINKIDGELKEIVDRKPSSSFVMQMGFKYGVKVVLGLVLVVFSLYYRYTPVFRLHDSINLIPFSTVMCYPNAVNEISFHFWAMCCHTVSRLI